MSGRKQLFKQYDKSNTQTFLGFLKRIHQKFQKSYLFMYKASPHYKSRRMRDYLEENKDTLISIYLLTASPEFMILEEVWDIAKRDLHVLKQYSSFEDFKQKVSCYFRTNRFDLNMSDYLLMDI